MTEFEMADPELVIQRRAFRHEHRCEDCDGWTKDGLRKWWAIRCAHVCEPCALKRGVNRIASAV